MQPDFAAATDQEVVQRARGGQESAYRELLHRYQGPVFSLIYRMVRDRELAEDLAQETFVKVLNALDTYRPEFKFSSWIFKIANNAAIDHLRRRQLDTLSLDGAPGATTPRQMEETSIQLSDKGETPLQAVEARELGSAIEQAIGKLRPEYRACIILRHIEDRPYEEIAEPRPAAGHREDLHTPRQGRTEGDVGPAPRVKPTTPTERRGTCMTDNRSNHPLDPMEDQVLDRYLASLGRFSPGPGFGDRVMARVRVRAPVPARAPGIAQRLVRSRRWPVLAYSLSGAAAASSTALTAWVAANFQAMTAWA
ncbi:MAG: sigma-70 family RNA polymerase sigma factor, partial [Gemmatimonadetes bacterium]|nr:sigma-70 family RNA polymerase sigma factor [Gemmatimonadota bacterium]